MKGSKRFLALLLVFSLFVGINSEHINAAPKQVKKCIKKGSVQTCTYKTKKGKLTKKMITTYRKNGKKQKRVYNFYQGKLKQSKTYFYNKQGQLKTNKHGKAKRFIQNYYKNGFKGQYSTALYNKNGQIYYENSAIYQTDAGSTVKTYFGKNKKKTKKVSDFYSIFHTKRVIHNYNKQGQLKSNKHGKATRTIYSYKYNNIKEKNELVRKQTASYNSKGKLINGKVVNY